MRGPQAQRRVPEDPDTGLTAEHSPPPRRWSPFLAYEKAGAEARALGPFCCLNLQALSRFIFNSIRCSSLPLLQHLLSGALLPDVCICACVWVCLRVHVCTGEHGMCVRGGACACVGWGEFLALRCPSPSFLSGPHWVGLCLGPEKRWSSFPPKPSVNEDPLVGAETPARGPCLPPFLPR